MTGRSAQDLAWGLWFVSLASYVVYCLKSGSVVLYVWGIVGIPVLMLTGFGAIKEWGECNDVVPNPTISMRYRVCILVLVGMFIASDIAVHRATRVRDLSGDGWLLFLVLSHYVTTWTGKPPRSVFSRVHFAVPKLARIGLS